MKVFQETVGGHLKFESAKVDYRNHPLPEESAGWMNKSRLCLARLAWLFARYEQQKGNCLKGDDGQLLNEQLRRLQDKSYVVKHFFGSKRALEELLDLTDPTQVIVNVEHILRNDVTVVASRRSDPSIGVLEVLSDGVKAGSAGDGKKPRAGTKIPEQDENVRKSLCGIVQDLLGTNDLPMTEQLVLGKTVLLSRLVNMRAEVDSILKSLRPIVLDIPSDKNDFMDLSKSVRRFEHGVETIEQSISSMNADHLQVDDWYGTYLKFRDEVAKSKAELGRLLDTAGAKYKESLTRQLARDLSVRTEATEAELLQHLLHPNGQGDSDQGVASEESEDHNFDDCLASGRELSRAIGARINECRKTLFLYRRAHFT